MSPPRPALVRPAALGLAGGMLLGAIYLAVRAYLLSSYDCDAALSPEECGLEREVVTEMSKLFYFCSVGLLLVGSGVFLLFRKKPGAA